MNTGGETANILMAFGAEVSKEGLKNGVEFLKFLILNAISRKGKSLNSGEINMKSLIQSGEELGTLDINKEDAASFASKAKKAGISFGVFQKGEKQETIAFMKKDSELVNKLLEKILEEKAQGINEMVDSKILDEYIIGGNKTYFVDKDNPENFIETNVLEMQKTFIVDKDNPENNIRIKENMKDNTLEAEITIDGKTKILNNKDISNIEKKKEIASKAKYFKNSDLVYSEDEINKLKGAHKEKDDKRTMKQVENQIKEVREKQPSKPKKDKSKTKERGDR